MQQLAIDRSCSAATVHVPAKANAMVEVYRYQVRHGKRHCNNGKAACAFTYLSPSMTRTALLLCSCACSRHVVQSISAYPPEGRTSFNCACTKHAVTLGYEQTWYTTCAPPQWRCRIAAPPHFCCMHMTNASVTCTSSINPY